MSEFEVKSFRSEPVNVLIGDADKDGKRKEIIVRDITYGKHNRFKQILSNVWMKVQTAPQTAKYFDEIIRNHVAKGESIPDAINSIVNSISEIYKTLTEDDKVELLGILTDGQITKKVAESLQVGEVYSLLTWLIDRNLRAEKNFEASLNTTLMTNGSSEQK